MRSAKYKFTSIVNSKGAKCEVRNWTKSLLDKTVPGHFRFGQKILDIFVVTQRQVVGERQGKESVRESGKGRKAFGRAARVEN